MLFQTVLVGFWTSHTAMMASTNTQAILGLILILLGLYAQYRDSLQPIPAWVENHWYLFLSNHKLHVKSAVISSVLVVILGSTGMISILVKSYLQVWMAMPFSVPLIVSAVVMFLIALMPSFVGALPLIYLRRFPPDKWMSSRKDRLSNPRDRE